MEKSPIGYILSLEGADSIVSMSHLGRAREQGLRAIGPAHYGPGTYANGTGASGGFSAKGRELLSEIGCVGHGRENGPARTVGKEASYMRRR